MTEAELLAMLERRYREDRGNGPAWAFVPKVRDAAGFEARRTADAIAMSLWPSRGLRLHGFEIKTSRSDWLRELKNPAKAEWFMRLCDHWWLVTADDTIVQDGELPETWGLLVARGNRLVQKQAAALISIGDPPFTPAGRSFLAALLRSAARTHDVTPEEVQEAVAAAVDRERALHEMERSGQDETIGILRGRLDRFKETFGVALGDEEDTWRHGGRSASKVGAALRIVLDGEAEIERHERRLQQLLEQTERLASDLRQSLGLEAAA